MNVHKERIGLKEFCQKVDLTVEQVYDLCMTNGLELSGMNGVSVGAALHIVNLKLRNEDGWNVDLRAYASELQEKLSNPTKAQDRLTD